MPKSKLSLEERLERKRTAARLRQQRCRERKRKAAALVTAERARAMEKNEGENEVRRSYVNTDHRFVPLQPLKKRCIQPSSTKAIATAVIATKGSLQPHPVPNKMSKFNGNLNSSNYSMPPLYPGNTLRLPKASCNPINFVPQNPAVPSPNCVVNLSPSPNTTPTIISSEGNGNVGRSFPQENEFTYSIRPTTATSSGASVVSFGTTTTTNTNMNESRSTVINPMPCGNTFPNYNCNPPQQERARTISELHEPVAIHHHDHDDHYYKSEPTPLPHHARHSTTSVRGPPPGVSYPVPMHLPHHMQATQRSLPYIHPSTSVTNEPVYSSYPPRGVVNPIKRGTRPSSLPPTFNGPFHSEHTWPPPTSAATNNTTSSTFVPRTSPNTSNHATSPVNVPPTMHPYTTYPMVQPVSPLIVARFNQHPHQHPHQHHQHHSNVPSNHLQVDPRSHLQTQPEYGYNDDVIPYNIHPTYRDAHPRHMYDASNQSYRHTKLNRARPNAHYIHPTPAYYGHSVDDTARIDPDSQSLQDLQTQPVTQPAAVPKSKVNPGLTSQSMSTTNSSKPVVPKSTRNIGQPEINAIDVILSLKKKDDCSSSASSSPCPRDGLVRVSPTITNVSDVPDTIVAVTTAVDTATAFTAEGSHNDSIINSINAVEV